MAYTLGNTYAKNLCKRTFLLRLIIENVVTCFFGTQCSCTVNEKKTFKNLNRTFEVFRFKKTLKPRFLKPLQTALLTKLHALRTMIDIRYVMFTLTADC